MTATPEDSPQPSMTLVDSDVSPSAGTVRRRTRSSAWFAMGAGAALVLVGATFPWFVVGPASRLGVADDGWLCLLAGVAMIVGTVGARVTHRSGWLVAVGAGIVLSVGAVSFALLTPPEAMSVSAGPFISLAGAVLATGGTFAAWRSLDRPAVASNADAGPTDDGDSAPASTAAPSAIRSGVRWAGWVAATIILAVVVVASWPIDIDRLGPDPETTGDFESAVARFTDVTNDEPEFVFEPCRSRLYDHGERTDTVVVLFHGLTNCPRQYVEMAESIHAQGANVLVLRAPGHGHATSDGGRIAGAGALHTLTAEQLADYADDAVDIAGGLGDDIRVHGLSMGGAIALWTAQHRPEVDRVIAMAPAFELPLVPNAVSNLFTNLFARVPSITRSHDRHIDHDYAAFSSRGLAASFALGQAVMDVGLDVGPAVDDITVVLNPDDPLVNEQGIEALVAAWDRTRDVVDVVVLDAVGLPHDGIDLAQPDADPEEVYPIVMGELGFVWPGE